VGHESEVRRKTGMGAEGQNPSLGYAGYEDSGYTDVSSTCYGPGTVVGSRTQPRTRQAQPSVSRGQSQ
jgi:hypothetical protein